MNAVCGQFHRTATVGLSRSNNTTLPCFNEKVLMTIQQLMYRQPNYLTIWNDIRSNKRQELTTQHHLSQRLTCLCVAGYTQTNNILHNKLSHICRSIRHHFKNSVYTLNHEALVKWLTYRWSWPGGAGCWRTGCPAGCCGPSPQSWCCHDDPHSLQHVGVDLTLLYVEVRVTTVDMTNCYNIHQ